MKECLRRPMRVVVLILLLGARMVHGQSNHPPYYEDGGDEYQQQQYNNYANEYGSTGSGGDGDNSYYGDDHLYHDYAARHQDNGGGGLGAVGMGKLLVTSAFSWYMGGRFHAGRTAKKLKAKHQAEQKQLYSQYYDDVYKLSEKNQELQLYVEQLHEALKDTEAQHELEALQRDYDEFKQPDIDGDDRISRAEFNMYVKNYLSHYPGLDEKDYPKFEEFDHDGDGFVSFQEYAQQMALQAQKAEADALYKG